MEIQGKRQESDLWAGVTGIRDSPQVVRERGKNEEAGTREKKRGWRWLGQDPSEVALTATSGAAGVEAARSAGSPAERGQWDLKGCQEGGRAESGQVQGEKGESGAEGRGSSAAASRASLGAGPGVRKLPFQLPLRPRLSDPQPPPLRPALPPQAGQKCLQGFRVDVELPLCSQA